MSVPPRLPDPERLQRVKDILAGRIEITPSKEPPSATRHVMGGVATLVSLMAALFVGFIQLPGWLLFPPAAVAVYGMRYYHPAEFPTWRSYLWAFLGTFATLLLVAWLATLASLYVSGHFQPK